MRAYRSAQELYDHVDTVTGALRSAGFAEAAARIHGLLHETAWTTGNELMGELGNCFASILKATPSMPPAIAKELKGLVREIGRGQRAL